MLQDQHLYRTPTILDILLMIISIIFPSALKLESHDEIVELSPAVVNRLQTSDNFFF